VDQLVLGEVGVLELVDQDVLVAALVLGGHIRVLLEEQHRLHQQIVKVHGVAAPQDLLVGEVDAADDLAEVGVHPVGVDLRRQQFVLGGGDAVQQAARGEALDVDVELGGGLLDGSELVARVEDHVVLGVGGVLRLDAQDARAQGMERAQRQAAQFLPAEHPLDALLHLPRGLVGEGHGHDPEGGDAHGLHQVSDTVGQDARLAAARPGQDQVRACPGDDGVALLGIESLQERRIRHESGLPGDGSFVRWQEGIVADFGRGV